MISESRSFWLLDFRVSIDLNIELFDFASFFFFLFGGKGDKMKKISLFAFHIVYIGELHFESCFWKSIGTGSCPSFSLPGALPMISREVDSLPAVQHIVRKSSVSRYEVCDQLALPERDEDKLYSHVINQPHWWDGSLLLLPARLSAHLGWWSISFPMAPYVFPSHASFIGSVQFSCFFFCQSFIFNPCHSPFFYSLLCESPRVHFPPVFSDSIQCSVETSVHLSFQFFFISSPFEFGNLAQPIAIFLGLPPIRSCACFPSAFLKLPCSPSPGKTLHFSCFFLPPSSLFRICQGLCENFIFPILLFFLHRAGSYLGHQFLKFHQETDGPLESSMIYRQLQISLLGH